MICHVVPRACGRMYVCACVYVCVLQTPGSKEGAPAKEAAPAAAPAADKKEAKGLPSLEVRKKATKDEAK